MFAGQHRRNLLRALRAQLLNPFSQITRFANDGKGKRTRSYKVTDDWNKRIKTTHKVIGTKRKAEDIGPHAKLTPTMRSARRASSFPLLPSSDNMADGKGSENEKGLTETPVDDVMEVHRGPPNYSFASLPFLYSRIDDVVQNTQQWSWRMTSPYDVSVQAGVVDRNAGTGTTNQSNPASDGGDITAQNADWFVFYAGMYKYYHVVSCRWHLTVENLNTMPMWVHQYYSNETDRPSWATNQDMLKWSDTRSHYVGPIAHAIWAEGEAETNQEATNVPNEEDEIMPPATRNYESSNHVVTRGASPILSMSGSYEPGDYDRQIRLDADVENWTLTNTNPKLSERLHFRFKPVWNGQEPFEGNVNTYDFPLKYRWTIKLEYLVEFKELRDGLRYPTSAQPVSVSIVSTKTGAP